MRLIILFGILIISVLPLNCTADTEQILHSEETDFLRDIPPLSEGGYVNIIIEIPAGDNQKWEVDKSTGTLIWEEAGDSLRVINYLPYPANYGMVPRTLLPEEKEGDNDPIDIFLLGPAIERGSVVEGIVIGAIKMLDGGEQDDKLIAVDPESWFGHIRTMSELEKNFPGVIEILSLWMENYKGENIVEITGNIDASEAKMLLDMAIESFQNKQN